jgi:hypothetical protein
MTLRLSVLPMVDLYRDENPAQEAGQETRPAPLEPDPDAVAEQYGEHRDGYDDKDDHVGAETFH